MRHATPPRRGRLAASAAFLISCEVVASRHGLKPEAVRRRPTPEQLAAHARLAGRSASAADREQHCETPRIIKARREAIYLASVALGCGARAVARVAEVGHQSVLRAVTAIEEARTNPRYDRALDEAELQILGAM
jgi:hypothetical protein